MTNVGSFAIPSPNERFRLMGLCSEGEFMLNE